MEHGWDITEDTQNGVRLNFLIVSGGTKRLRLLFDSLVPPPTLTGFLAANEHDIKELLRKRIINKSQKDKLYPPVGPPASKNFDISLLYALLRNLCGLTNPVAGWGTKPATTDRSVGGAVEMIHWYRNKYSHPSEIEVDAPTFELSWKEISEAMNVLGDDAAQIDSLKEVPFLTGNCIIRLAKFDFTAEVNCYASKRHPGTREWVFTYVNNWFLNRGSDSRVLIIIGNAGMGKSVIAAQVCRTMRHEGLLGGLHFCQHNNQRRRKPELMLQSLAKHLCDLLPGFKDILTGQLASVKEKELASMDVEELFTHLLQETTNMMMDPGKNILLVVDALDECEHEGRNRLLDVIMCQFHKLPSWIKFLVTGRPENEIAKKLSHLKPFVLHARDKNNEKDIEIIFKDHLHSILPDSVIADNVNRLVKQADGLMLYAHYFIQFVKDNQDALSPENLNEIFPRGIASVYEQYFDRLQMNLGVDNGPFSDFLASLAAARSPLPVTIASRILGLCLDVEDGNSREIQEISGHISCLLPIRNACIDVFHKSILDWLSCPQLYGDHRFSVDVRRGEAVLSNECHKTFKAIEDRHDVLKEFSPEEHYALQHGTHHSIAFARVNESQKNTYLFRYICSLELLFAKLQSKVCDVFSIIEELQSVRSILKLCKDDTLELEDCINCLRRHPYVLLENPKTLFQFFINEADTVAMSLEACSVMQQPKYRLPICLEVVNRAQSKDPVIAKFRCKTNVNCCDVLFNNAYSLLVCGCKGGIIHMFSLETGRGLWCCQGNELKVWPEEERCDYCVFVPQHNAVIHGRFDIAVSFDGEAMQLFQGNKHTFIDASASQDRKKLVTRETNLTSDLMVWELETGELLARLNELGAAESITCCTISSCGQFVISGSLDYGVSVWDIDTPDLKCHRNAFNDEHPVIVDCLNGVKENPKFVLLNSSKKQSLTICELGEGPFESSTPTHVQLGSAHRSLGVSSDGACLYVSGDSQYISSSSLPFVVRIVPISCATRWGYAREVDSERVLLRDYDTLYMCHSLESTNSEVMIDRRVQAVLFSVDGKLVYVLSKNGMSMYEASSGRFLSSNTSITNANAFAMSPGGTAILIHRKDKFELYNANLVHQRTFEHPVGDQMFFQYIDDDRVLILSRMGEVQVFNLATSNLTLQRTDESTVAECCDMFSFERNANKESVMHHRLLCCDRKGGLRLRDTFKERTYTQNVSKGEIVKCCKFSLGGGSVATGHIDGTVRIWDGRKLELKKILMIGDVPVKGCAYLIQDLGNFLVSLDNSGVLKVWDAFPRGRQCELSFMNFEGKVRGLVTSPSSAQICVALENKIVIINVHTWQ